MLIEVKTSNLIGPPLDWAVAQIEGVTIKREYSGDDGNGNCVIWLSYKKRAGEFAYSPSTDWSQCGPLIEKYKLRLVPCDAGYFSYTDNMLFEEIGETALIAACRAIIEFKLGSTVQVPAGLMSKVER